MFNLEPKGMTNIELKSKIGEIVSEPELLDKTVILEDDEFAEGAIGLTDDFRVVYSYERLVHSLAKTIDSEQCIELKEERAAEYLDYNTLRMIPYWNSQGLLAPIIIHEFL